MDPFEQAVEFILRHEGGYVHDADDPGGETKWGISKRSYPDLDIKELTREEAIGIYRKDYWDRYQCGALPWPASLVRFDSLVLCGRKAMSWGEEWENILFERLAHHLAISARGNMRKYLRGWLARVLDLWAICRKERAALTVESG